LDHRPAHGGVGHGEDRPEDPADDRADREREEDDHGVQAQRAAHDDRLEDVALDLVDDDDPGDERERDDRPVGHEGHERGEDARERRADDGDEGRDEHDHRERDRQRHPGDDEEGADEDGVDERDERGPADVAAEHLGAAVDRLGELGPPLALEPPQREVPHRRPVLEEEEQDDDDEDGTGDDLRRGGDAGDRPAGDGAAREELPGPAQRLVDGGGVDRQRPGGEEALELVPALGGLGGQRVPLAAHGEHDPGDDPADDDEDPDERGERGEEVRPAAALEPLDGGGDGRGEDEGDEQGDDDDLHAEEQPGGADDDGGDEQRLRRAGGRAAHPVGPRTEGGGGRLGGLAVVAEVRRRLGGGTGGRNGTSHRGAPRCGRQRPDDRPRRTVRRG